MSLARNIVLPLLVMFIYDRYFTERPRIIVTDESYILETGKDRIIMPKNIYERKKALRDPSAVDRHIARGFAVLEEDLSVSDFGFTKKLEDHHPLAEIPRDDFAILSRHTDLVLEEEGERIVDQREKLVVLRAILARGNRKWQFVWNGIQISAPIIDQEFYDALARHEYVSGQGDVLDVILRIFQKRNDSAMVYLNVDYQVTKVFGKSSAPRQESFLP